jgi:hypothetical protein
MRWRWRVNELGFFGGGVANLPQLTEGEADVVLLVRSPD